MKLRARTGAAPHVYPSAIVDPGAELGLDTVVGAFCFIANGAQVGAGTRIQSHTSVWAGVMIGEDVFVGPAAVFTNIRRPRAAFMRAPAWDPTTVGNGASLGAGSVLVCPIHVGRGAMIGAGAVATRDVPAHAMVAGNPARIVGWACACGERLTKAARRPERARCAHCDRAYERDDADGLAEATARSVRRSRSPSRSSPRGRR